MKQPHIYLIASYVIKPRNPRMTFQKDYVKQEENIQYSESVSIARNLKPRDYAQAQVIIDIVQEKIIKCSYQGAEKSYQSLIAYYGKHYPNYVTPILERLGRIPKIAQESGEAQLSP